MAQRDESELRQAAGAALQAAIDKQGVTGLHLADNPAGYRMLAELYLGQKQWDKALAELASLYSEHPKDAVVAKMYAELLLQQNRLDDASKVTDALLKDAPSDPGAIDAAGPALDSSGQSYRRRSRLGTSREEILRTTPLLTFNWEWHMPPRRIWAKPNRNGGRLQTPAGDGGTTSCPRSPLPCAVATSRCSKKPAESS